MSAAGTCHARGLGCGKPPGPARGRGSPPGITTAIAVKRPLTTLVAMTALPPLMALGTARTLDHSGVQHPARTPPLRIVGQVALRVQRDRTSYPQESQTRHISHAGFARPGPGVSRAAPGPAASCPPAGGGSGAMPCARSRRPGYPLTSGPARSIETLMMTRRSRSMAARYSAQSGCSPAVRR